MSMYFIKNWLFSENNSFFCCVLRFLLFLKHPVILSKPIINPAGNITAWCFLFNGPFTNGFYFNKILILTLNFISLTLYSLQPCWTVFQSGAWINNCTTLFRHTCESYHNPWFSKWALVREPPRILEGFSGEENDLFPLVFHPKATQWQNVWLLWSSFNML